jgi:lysozyme family protein
MEQYQKIIGFILQAEGGYVWNKNDPGGETNYGISKRSYPELDIKNLPVQMAIDIYKRDYYSKVVDEHMTFDQAAFMMDTAVNMGIGTARRFWQDGSGELKQMLALRKNRYEELIKKNPKLEVFRKGWMNRLTHLIQFIDSNKAA